MNRINASRLYELSTILDVPIAFFFDGLRDTGRTGSMAESTPVTAESDPMVKRETLELVRAYYRITDGKVRKCLRDMVLALASGRKSASD